MAKLREDQIPATEEKSEDSRQTKGTSSDKADKKNLPADKQQTVSQGTVMAKNSDGTVIFKGKTDQDEKRAVDAERKQTELEKMEKKEQRAIEFQASILGEANNTMKSAAKTNVTGTNDKAQANAKNNAFIVPWGETQTAQQKFHIAFG